MIRWQWFKQFPKWAIVVVVLFGSTGLFGLRWWLRSGKTPQPIASNSAPRAEAEAAPDRRAESLPDRVDRLFLADGDLYDSENGELIFKNWLRGAKPVFIYYQEEQQKFIGHFDRGFERYNLDGSEDGTLGSRYGIVVSSDLKQAVFARERDMWISEIDWPNFKLSMERPVTKSGNISEPMMLQNNLLGSKKFILQRHQRQVSRINLSSGELTKSRFGLNDIQAEARSLDGSMLMGQEAGKKLFAYDIDTDAAATLPVGGRKVEAILWADGNNGFALVGGNEVYGYDRGKNAFEKICNLPQPASKLENASPDGRYAFARTKSDLILVDRLEKQVVPMKAISGNGKWVTASSLLYSNDIPDAELRGTWLQKVGKEPVRISPEPYSVGRDGMAAVVTFPDLGRLVFAGRNAILRVGLDGTGIREIAPLSRPIARMIKVVHLETVRGGGKPN